MEKFSLYELLSFIIPGASAIALLELYLKNIFGFTMLFDIDNIILESIPLLVLSLLVGVLIHILNFKILDLKWMNSYKNLVFKDIKTITNNDKHVGAVIPFLKAGYEQYNRHQQYKENTEILTDDIFDLAYYYLEVNDKIGATKNYQSLYFWLRNSILLCLIFTLLGFTTYIGLLIFKETAYTPKFIQIFSIINFLIALLLIVPTQWLRKKMVIKLFWSYYVEMLEIKPSSKN